MIGGKASLGEDFLTRQKPSPKNIAADFHLHELFFSRTDHRGIIKAGNSVFTRVSGYRQEELLHHPHNVIRHPDMPRAVFELFWEFLKAERPVCAYVKNLAKDGCYYWVYAAAFPVEDGYLSLRLKPSSPMLEQIKTLYRKLLATETSQGIPAAREELKRAVNELGFEDYEHFMTRALFDEIQSRQHGLNTASPVKGKQELDKKEEEIFLPNLYRETGRLGHYSSKLFNNLIQVVENSASMNRCSHTILGLFSRLKLLSINMTIAAEKLGQHSQTLVVVAESFQDFARDIKAGVEELEAALMPLKAAIRDAEFKCGASQLQAEMLSIFSGELTESQSTEERLEYVRNCNHLFHLIQSYTSEVESSLKKLVDTVSNFEEQSAALNSVISGLEVIRVRGTMEAVQLPSGDEFLSHIHSMQEFVRTIREALVVLIKNAHTSHLSARAGQDILAPMFKQLTSLAHELDSLAQPSA